MALIKPDFSEVSKPIQPGTYNARVVAGEIQTSQKGQPMVSWKLELFGSPDVNNRVVFTRTMVSGPGASRLKQLYAAAIGEDLKDGEQFDTDSLIGKEINVTLVQGKDKEGNVSQYPDVKATTPYRAM